MKFSKEKADSLIEILKIRFQKNPHRHNDIRWADVENTLRVNREKLSSLNEMEITGGEPDIISFSGKVQIAKPGEFIFVDCSDESPKGRRSLCYDDDALKSRKENRPKDSAMNLASKMGVEILTEDQYRQLQQLGIFDTKTSSWVRTPENVRKLGGALFCDRRYDTVFLYHNGAESFYAARGFRTCLKI
ncbi:MAG: DUF4256 domain-containing protein [Ginsengibacter sp.]